jgi:phage terminase large subunit
MQGWTLNITKASVDLIRDMRNYTWEKDRDGNVTSIPIHDYSHGPDALRYALFSEFAGSGGNYTIGFNR